MRRLRRSHDLTTDALGLLAGVPGPSIRRWETRGHGIGSDALYRIARVLGVTVDSLLANPPERFCTDPLTAA